MEDTKEKKDLTSVLKRALKARNNPTDLKEIHIGTVILTEPVTVTIFEGKVTLTENQELFISEWFRFRCDIDKTEALTSTVPDKLNSSKENYRQAKNITEKHSFSGADCIMPQAISFLASAIENTNSAIDEIKKEVLALKCELKAGDFVIIGSLAQQDRYILLDKVLSDVS